VQGEQRFKPTVPINPSAYNVHKIKWEDLQNCPPHKNVLAVLQDSVPHEVYWIGHKVQFDKRMIEQSSGQDLNHVKLICTHSLATALLPETVKQELPDMKLATLCGHFFPDYLSEITSESHTAIGDCTLVLLLLEILLNYSPAFTWEELYAAQQNSKSIKGSKESKPKLLSVWPPFGKYKLTSFDAIPADYLRWARDNLDFSKNKNLLFTINHYLQ